MASITSRHEFGYTSGANDVARMYTLIGDGPLSIAEGHYLAVEWCSSARRAAMIIKYENESGQARRGTLSSCIMVHLVLLRCAGASVPP